MDNNKTVVDNDYWNVDDDTMPMDNIDDGKNIDYNKRVDYDKNMEDDKNEDDDDKKVDEDGKNVDNNTGYKHLIILIRMMMVMLMIPTLIMLTVIMNIINKRMLCNFLFHPYYKLLGDSFLDPT